jgi:hypothetical protein
MIITRYNSNGTIAETITIKAPKEGNTETVEHGSTVSTTRRGIVRRREAGYTSPSTPATSGRVMFVKKRWDFERLTLTKKEALITFLVNSIGQAVTVQLSTGDACSVTLHDGTYIVDDQPLEVIKIHDGCSYDCATFWIYYPDSVNDTTWLATEAGQPLCTENFNPLTRET